MSPYGTMRIHLDVGHEQVHERLVNLVVSGHVQDHLLLVLGRQQLSHPAQREINQQGKGEGKSVTCRDVMHVHEEITETSAVSSLGASSYFIMYRDSRNEESVDAEVMQGSHRNNCYVVLGGTQLSHPVQRDA